MLTLIRDDYTIMIICPLPEEAAPVLAMLHEVHPRLASLHDKIQYTFGPYANHNVVIASLPGAGNNGAASVAN